MLTKCLRFKVKSSSKEWLDGAAREVNYVWNWANETSLKAARPFVGRGKWLTNFDLDALSSGASAHFKYIGADVIQRVNLTFTQSRRKAKRLKLRWRASDGSRRALGWVPFKAKNLKRKGRQIRFFGKSLRIFEANRLKGAIWRDGCFAQDAVGDWWLCLPIRVVATDIPAPREIVGIDLGLKDVATTSDGSKLRNAGFYRGIESKIAQAQRRGHKRQAKRLHRKAARQRKDALHKFSRRIVEQYQNIIIGDVSSAQLVKTRMAKSVLDAGWVTLRAQLQYKGQQAGRRVVVVNEAFTTRACSGCGALSGPAGRTGLAVRIWRCSDCGTEHDRDVNAARNIAMLAPRCQASVCGNESRKAA